MKVASKRAKGTKLEKFVMDFFNKLDGWKARKQPGSGIYQDFPHDVFAEHEQLGKLIIECKAWKNGWLTGDRAMGKADALVIKRNHGQPMVYTSLEKFGELVEGQRLPNEIPVVLEFEGERLELGKRPWPKRKLASRGFQKAGK